MRHDLSVWPQTGRAMEVAEQGQHEEQQSHREPVSKQLE